MSQAVTATGAPDSYAGGWVGATGNSTSTAHRCGHRTRSYVGGGPAGSRATSSAARRPAPSRDGSKSAAGRLAHRQVSRSYATGNVTATALYVGGLPLDHGNATNTYALGDVTPRAATSRLTVGPGDVVNSYSAAG